MPQMSPLLWLNLYLYFIMIMIMIMMMLYFLNMFKLNKFIKYYYLTYNFKLKW